MAKQLQNANIYSWYSALACPVINLTCLRSSVKMEKSGRYTFWTVGWTFKNANGGGYFGLQTSDNPNEFNILGSIWNALGGKPGDDGAYLVKFGGEGIGYSVRKDHLNIDTSVPHHFRVEKCEGNVTTWQFYFDNWFLGEIYCPNTFQNISHTGIYNFTEYYGSDIEECSDIPLSVVIWNFPTFNTFVQSYFSHESKGLCPGNDAKVEILGTNKSKMTFGNVLK